MKGLNARNKSQNKRGKRSTSVFVSKANRVLVLQLFVLVNYRGKDCVTGGNWDVLQVGMSEFT